MFVMLCYVCYVELGVGTVRTDYGRTDRQTDSDRETVRYVHCSSLIGRGHFNSNHVRVSLCIL